MAKRQASRRARKNSKESVRLALARGLVRALVAHGAIETSEAHAKVLKPFIDKLVTRVREGSPASRRLIFARLGQDKEAVEGLFVRVSQVNGRTSGFTRIVKLGSRIGDRAPMARLEWVDKVEVKSEKLKVKSEKTEETSETKKTVKISKKGSQKLAK